MHVHSACLVGISIALLACDLPPKDIGKESESNSGSASGESGSSDGGVPCSEPEPRPESQASDPCVCIDGEWSCSSGPAVCEAGEQSASPDGCNDCGCDEGQWSCTKLSCAPGWFGDAIFVCDPGAPADPLGIETAVIEHDVLRVGVNYGGGCEHHDFGLCWDGAFAESAPVQISTVISHEDHDDPCEASPHQDLVFDLLPLRLSYQQGYQTEHGAIAIDLAGWDGSILYTF